MKPPIAVIQCECHPERPTAPGVVPGLLVYELERAGYPVFRWHASEFHLEALADEMQEAGCRLVVLDAETSVQAVVHLRSRLGRVPIVLVGDAAADKLIATGVSYAIAGVARPGVVGLAGVLARLDANDPLSADDLAQVPNLLYRTDATLASDSRDGHWIDGSDCVVPWNVDVELFPFAPPVSWNYRGPAGRNPAVDRVRLSVTGMPGCVHPSFVDTVPTPLTSAADVPGKREEEAPEFSPRARVIRTVADNATADCPLGLCWSDDTTREQALSRALEQTAYFWDQGIRSFRLRGVNSIELAKGWLETLAARSQRPEEVVLSPSVRELRRGESGLVNLLRENADTHFVITGTTFWFNSLFERTGQPSSWESRWAGRLLTRLAREFPSLTCLQDHDVILLDPETSLQHLLDSLQAIEEDTPFLKRSLNGGASLSGVRPTSRIGRYLAREGLLIESGQASWCFRDPELSTFVDLAGRGQAPLLESIGRLRAQPEVRDALVAEGVFRWFRELARYLIDNRGSSRRAEDGWGRILAAVVQDLERDRTGST